MLIIRIALVALLAHGEDCFDRNIDCGEWGEDGGCDDPETSEFMLDNCPAACGICPELSGAPPTTPWRRGLAPKRRERPRAPSRAPARAPSRGRSEL